MTYGSLFSGGGLGDFGFELAGFECKWQVEYDPTNKKPWDEQFNQKILSLRFPHTIKKGDIKDVKELEAVDIISGGPPCQCFSCAGKRKGKADDRYLWPEMYRIIKIVKPRWVVFENVPGITNLALDDVLSDLETEGYEGWPIIFPAHALGAWHKRDRLWIVGYSERNGCKNRHTQTMGTLGESKQRRMQEFERTGKTFSNSNKTRRRKQSRTESISQKQPTIKYDSKNVSDTISGAPRTAYQQRIQWSSDKKYDIRDKIWSNAGNRCKTFRWFWQSEPRLGRVAHGIANRVDRLKCIGNGQVPACTFLIAEFIKEIERCIK